MRLHDKAQVNIFSAVFGTRDALKVCGVERHLLNLWVSRGLITPSHIDADDGGRSRLGYSVVTCFQVRLQKHLTPLTGVKLPSRLGIGLAQPNLSLAGPKLADEGWMWAVARSVDRKQPLNVLGAVAWDDHARLDFDIGLTPGAFDARFNVDATVLIIPIGRLFAEVYEACVAIMQSREPAQ